MVDVEIVAKVTVVGFGRCGGGSSGGGSGSSSDGGRNSGCKSSSSCSRSCGSGDSSDGGSGSSGSRSWTQESIRGQRWRHSTMHKPPFQRNSLDLGM